MAKYKATTMLIRRRKCGHGQAGAPTLDWKDKVRWIIVRQGRAGSRKRKGEVKYVQCNAGEAELVLLLSAAGCSD